MFVKQVQYLIYIRNGCVIGRSKEEGNNFKLQSLQEIYNLMKYWRKKFPKTKYRNNQTEEATEQLHRFQFNSKEQKQSK